MKNSLIIALGLALGVFVGCAHPPTPVANYDEATLDHRLEYHGYFFKRDLLKETETLEALNDYSNMLVCSLFEPSDYFALDWVGLMRRGEVNDVAREIFARANERLELAHVAGFTVIFELPLTHLIYHQMEDDYVAMLKVLKQQVPAFADVDYVYLWDEPDINATPDYTVLAHYIDLFKTVFPEVGVSTCYAIASPKFLETRIPPNIDLLMIDPYFLTRGYEQMPADFAAFWRERLALGLAWIRAQGKPWLVVGDSFAAPPNKPMPTPASTMWYYQIAMMEPDCVGLLWFCYGTDEFLEEAEGLHAFTLDGASEPLVAMHRAIGQAIFAEPLPLGVPWEVMPPEPHQALLEFKDRVERGENLTGLKP